MANVTLKDGAAADFTYANNPNGQAARAASKPVTLATEDAALLDGIEASLTAIAASLVTIDGRVDGLEALQTTANGYLDGVETAIASTNTKLDTLDGRVDGLEAAIGAAADAAWTSGSGSLVALNKATAGAAIDTTTASPVKPGGRDHETVAASQTDQVLGPTGAPGDILDGMLVVPASLSPGAVSIEYGATNITVFAGGTDSLLTLHPFWIELGSIASVGGGWEVTTGANVSVIAVGDFS